MYAAEESPKLVFWSCTAVAVRLTDHPPCPPSPSPSSPCRSRPDFSFRLPNTTTTTTTMMTSPPSTERPARTINQTTTCVVSAQRCAALETNSPSTATTMPAGTRTPPRAVANGSLFTPSFCRKATDVPSFTVGIEYNLEAMKRKLSGANGTA